VDSTQLEEFLVLAAERNFHVAARRLNLSQPTLTRHINQLEKTAGTRLFDRDRRGASLTLAGTALLREAPGLLDHQRRTVELLNRIGAERKVYLRIGHIGAGLTVLRTALRAVNATYPDVELSVSEHTIRQGRQHLCDGHLDLLLTRPPIHDKHIEEAFLYIEPLLIALPASHPAAAASAVDLNTLDDLPFIVPAAREAPGAHSTVAGALRNITYTPARTHEVDDIPSLLLLVGAGLGFGFITKGTAEHAHDPAVRTLPLAGADTSIPLHIAWRRDDSRPTTIDLRQALSDAATSHRN
jgi:DNA-binding transcriptional LysR family regulator